MKEYEASQDAVWQNEVTEGRRDVGEAMTSTEDRIAQHHEYFLIHCHLAAGQICDLFDEIDRLKRELKNQEEQMWHEIKNAEERW